MCLHAFAHGNLFYSCSWFADTHNHWEVNGNLSQGCVHKCSGTTFNVSVEFEKLDRKVFRKNRSICHKTGPGGGAFHSGRGGGEHGWGEGGAESDQARELGGDRSMQESRGGEDMVYEVGGLEVVT